MHNKSSRPGFWKIDNIEKEDEQAKINNSKRISMNKHNTKIILSLNLLLIQEKHYNYIFYLYGTKKKNLVCPVLSYRIVSTYLGTIVLSHPLCNYCSRCACAKIGSIHSYILYRVYLKYVC
jgi:hypothetical protein